MAIGGGHTGTSLAKALLVRPMRIDDVRFVTLPKVDRRLHSFLNGEFAMYELLVAKRNAAVESAMAAMDVAADPLDTGDGQPVRKRPKRIYADEIQKTLDVSVRVHSDADEQGEEHVIKVLSSITGQGPLGFEMSEQSFQVLLKKPHTCEIDSLIPDIVEPSVSWHRSTRTLICTYFSQRRGKWRRKHSPKIAPGPILDVQQRVNDFARELQEFHETNHYAGPGVPGEADDIEDE